MKFIDIFLQKRIDAKLEQLNKLRRVFSVLFLILFSLGFFAGNIEVFASIAPFSEDELVLASPEIVIGTVIGDDNGQDEWLHPQMRGCEPWFRARYFQLKILKVEKTNSSLKPKEIISVVYTHLYDYDRGGECMPPLGGTMLKSVPSGNIKIYAKRTPEIGKNFYKMIDGGRYIKQVAILETEEKKNRMNIIVIGSIVSIVGLLCFFIGYKLRLKK